VHSSYASAAASAASLISDSLINACWTTRRARLRCCVSADRVSYLTECRYPDGTQVLCAATAEVSNGLITGLTGRTPQPAR
jgi:hypothetical protein